MFSYFIFCRFKASNNDHIVEVNINDEIDFVCPYSDGIQYEDPNKHEFYIVYQVSAVMFTY